MRRKRINVNAVDREVNCLWKIYQKQKGPPATRLITLVENLPQVIPARQQVRKGHQAGATVENLPQLNAGTARDKADQAAKAKERQATSTGGTKPQLVETLPQAEKGKSRDLAGASGKSIGKGSVRDASERKAKT